MTRRGLVAGMVLLGGCIQENPMFVDTTTGTGGATLATTGEAPTTGASSSGEPTSTTATTTLTTMSMGYCGDGQVDPGEACDDGDADPDNGCSNLCQVTGCGDGILQAGEICDDGNFSNNDDCLDTCVPASCGDGYIQVDVEVCDDGNLADTDDCLATCVPASCGDGIVREGGMEDCDDGNLENSDACLANCKQASCGDGVIWKDIEACDDGNFVDEDACRNDCTPPPPYNLIFISSQPITGKIGGLAAADKLCQDLADKAKLAGTFRAWLGDSKSGPIDRLYKSPSPYIRTDSVLVAKNWADLTDGTLNAPIDRTEAGVLAMMGPGACMGGSPIHTNVKKDGAPGDPLNTCMDWTSETGYVHAGLAGPAGQFGGLWTDACDISCATSTSIYCVQG